MAMVDGQREFALIGEGCYDLLLNLGNVCVTLLNQLICLLITLHEYI
jgi:hypothetical protein